VNIAKLVLNTRDQLMAAEIARLVGIEFRKALAENRDIEHSGR